MQGCLGTSVEVTTCQQIFGGASRETFLVTADIDGQNRDVVVRCEQAAGLIDTQVTTEVWALEQVADLDLPAPKVLGFTECTDEQTGVLVLERLPGEAAGLTVPDPYAGIEDAIGKDFWRHLGTMVRPYRESTVLRWEPATSDRHQPSGSGGPRLLGRPTAEVFHASRAGHRSGLPTIA